MHSLLTRSVILSISRFANQAIMLFSPVILVRILSVAQYGSYREFMLYAGLIGSIVSFGAPRSLSYFLPKYPDKQAVWITQANLFVATSSMLTVAGLLLSGDLLRENTSFDFVSVLAIYIVFSVNLNFLEYYWLAKKRSDYVLYFSTGRLAARIAIVIAVGILTKSAAAIVTALVWIELIRFVFVLIFSLRNRLLTLHMSRSDFAYQLSFFVPLGFGAIIVLLNRRFGQLFVSTNIGSEALAIYVIGWFAMPIVNTFRGAIADVIFPEIMELKSSERKDQLPLWRRATIAYCLLLLPTAAFFAINADALVIILFTDEYAAAIPLFSIFSMLLVTACFDFHLPLRVQNANRHFVFGNIIAFLVNVVLIYPLYIVYGLPGPALALIISEIALTLYLGYQAIRIYGVSPSSILAWKDIAIIMLAVLLCVPVLIAGQFMIENLPLRSVATAVAFLVLYMVFLYIFGVFNVIEFARSRMSARKY